mgnify:CR=1 FL=1
MVRWAKNRYQQRMRRFPGSAMRRGKWNTAVRYRAAGGKFRRRNYPSAMTRYGRTYRSAWTRRMSAARLSAFYRAVRAKPWLLK